MIVIIIMIMIIVIKWSNSLNKDLNTPWTFSGLLLFYLCLYLSVCLSPKSDVCNKQPAWTYVDMLTICFVTIERFMITLIVQTRHSSIDVMRCRSEWHCTKMAPCRHVAPIGSSSQRSVYVYMSYHNTAAKCKLY